jgi:hypothetical protein
LINYEIANSKELLVIYLELNQLLGEKLIWHSRIKKEVNNHEPKRISISISA